jgi:hypothetical protein
MISQCSDFQCVRILVIRKRPLAHHSPIKAFNYSSYKGKQKEIVEAAVSGLLHWFLKLCWDELSEGGVQATMFSSWLPLEWERCVLQNLAK